MSDRVQPGVKIDAELWEQFRDDVKRRRGSVRGHLRTEVQNALRDYIVAGEATTQDIDARLQRIEAAMGVAPTDGGSDTVSPDEHTHAPTVMEYDGKPAANAATEKKVAYLADCVREELNGGTQEIPRPLLVDVVKSEYAFRSDTAKRYVERLVDHFDLREHPRNDTVLVTDEQYERLVEERREKLQQDNEQ